MAEARTNKAIHMIGLLGALSNSEFYDYTEEDIVKIKCALTNAITQMECSLKRGSRVIFSLTK